MIFFKCLFVISDIIVKQTATVKDLKNNIKHFFKTKSRGHKNFADAPQILNWKHVWKSYCLMHADQKLLDNDRQLRDYGVKNKSQLSFHKNDCRKN